MNPSTLIRAYMAHDLGATLHRIARAIVPLVAAIYVAGLATGDFVHWLNERLAGRGRSRWAAPVRRRPVALLTAAAQPLVVRGSYVFSYSDLTVAQLRKEAARRGLPRTLYTKGRRADLLEVLCAS